MNGTCSKHFENKSVCKVLYNFEHIVIDCKGGKKGEIVLSTPLRPKGGV
jgi:hypothetical protein